MESKKDIRKHVLEKRNLLTEQEWKEKSYCIYEKVVAHPFFLHADAIYCFIDYRKEVQTRAIIEHAWKLSKRVAVPKVDKDAMDFFYIQCFNELQEGFKGIPEPEAKYPAKDENVLVIMPGAAFDIHCNRIGYGKGYYDRYLSIHPNFKTMALAFELQMVKSIPADTYDICPNIIITEEHTYEQ